MNQALLDTQQAFDSIASAYDESHADNQLIHALRQRLRAAIVERVPPGSRLLDLGCGPGRDAVWFARRGYRLVAIDWSAEMVRQAGQRVLDAGVSAAVDVRHCGIQDVDVMAGIPFDAAYADLGPLNCVPNLSEVSARIASCLRPGGVLVASVMTRVCPWEILLHLARGDSARARVRFAPSAVGVRLGDGTAWTRYYTPREFERPFLDAGLTRESLRSLHLLVPPPYCHAFAARHPRVISLLQQADDVVGWWPGLRTMGDHFLIVLAKPS